MNFHSYVFPFSKKDYIRGKKPDVKCILCSVIQKDKRVQSLEILRTDKFVISLNLFPYNNGHALIFPLRHITDIRELSEEEDIELARLTKSYITLLEEIYKPTGYNVGYNLGEYAGASISHLHLHIIPRYQNELGVIDLIGGSKVLVENPLETLEKIKSHIKDRNIFNI
ncbi:MAG: HIT domain-containing protein [Brevinematales bacterium]